MEIDQVPQDDENVFEGKFKVLYAVDKNGMYTKVPTKGWNPENIALNQAWEVINEKIQQAKKEVEEGRLSPLGYYMEKNLMDTTLLAEYMGFSLRKVKKHLIPAIFETLDKDVLEKYASLFRISEKELLHIN